MSSHLPIDLETIIFAYLLPVESLSQIHSEKLIVHVREITNKKNINTIDVKAFNEALKVETHLQSLTATT